MGDQCSRVTQSQAVYYETVISGSAAGLFICTSSCMGIGDGTYFSLAAYSSCIESATQAHATVTNYNVNQSRVATTLPAGAGGTTSYSAWTNTSGAYPAGGYSCDGPPPNGPN